MKNLRKIYELYEPFRGKMARVFIFIIVLQGLGLTGPYIQGKTIDVIAKHRPINDAIILAVIALAITMIRGVVIMYWREKYEIKYIDYPVPRHMNLSTLKRLLSLSLGQHITENSGLKQSVVSRGQHSLATLGPMVLYNIFPTISSVVIMIIALLYWSAMMGFVVFAGVCLFCASMIYTNIKLGPDLNRMEKRYNDNAKFTGEVIRNADLVISNAQEERAIRECDAKLATAQEYEINIWNRFLIMAVVRNIILNLTRFAVAVLGIYYVYEGRYSLGTLVIFWSWSSNACNDISQIGSMHRQLVELYAAIKKYFSMLDMESDVPVIANPVRLDIIHGDIEFKNVTLAYRRRDLKFDMGEEQREDEEEPKINGKKDIGPALDGISFKIPAGKRIAIVGESGAGKSTLVYALMRGQDPDHGQILIDGQDLRLLDLQRYRRSIGYVPQHVPLFDQTIEYNITYGLDPDVKVSDEMLDRIAEMACIDRFFNRLEHGYQTMIGEKGIKLSGGERQRVGIARALIKNPSILIFDEATSNLDSENESLIRRSIEEASKGRTTIIVAHRFSTIRNVDKVLVFDGGKLVGEGTHEELLTTCPEYTKLLANQLMGIPADS